MTPQELNLLPCPFCGSAAEVVHASHIRCINALNCDGETRLGEIAWNRRSDIAARELAALKQAMAEMRGFNPHETVCEEIQDRTAAILAEKEEGK